MSNMTVECDGNPAPAGGFHCSACSWSSAIERPSTRNPSGGPSSRSRPGSHDITTTGRVRCNGSNQTSVRRRPSRTGCGIGTETSVSRASASSQASSASRFASVFMLFVLIRSANRRPSVVSTRKVVLKPWKSNRRRLTSNGYCSTATSATCRSR